MEQFNKYVIFKTNGEEYGINIQHIESIEENTKITRVPKTFKSILGVINLRGVILPVADMGLRLGHRMAQESDDTRIIVFKHKELEVGFKVDEAREVIDIAKENIDKATNITTKGELDCVLGVAKLPNRIITLINVEQLLVFN